MTRALALICGVAVGLSGCTSFELSRVRNEVDRTPGVDVGEGYALAFGRLSFGTVRTTLRVAGDDEQSRALAAALGHVRKADLARYRLREAPDLETVQTPRTIRRYERKGWTRALAARDADAAVWLMSRDDGDGELRKLLLVTMLPRELIIARLDGRLEQAAVAFAQQIEIAGLDDLAGRVGTVADSLTAADG